MSKGSKRRPTLVGKEEEDLRWKVAFNKATEEEKDRLTEILKGK